MPISGASSPRMLKTETTQAPLQLDQAEVIAIPGQECHSKVEHINPLGNYFHHHYDKDSRRAALVLQDSMFLH